MKHEKDLEQCFIEDLPLFAPGQVVQHRRYGYRGVIVDFDMRCRADENWYGRNLTQPDRNQPWYHVLVDGSTLITYAAQSSLEIDSTDQPIRHPLVDYFFHGFKPGRYQRNDQPWGGWDG